MVSLESVALSRVPLGKMLLEEDSAREARLFGMLLGTTSYDAVLRTLAPYSVLVSVLRVSLRTSFELSNLELLCPKSRYLELLAPLLGSTSHLI